MGVYNSVALTTLLLEMPNEATGIHGNVGMIGALTSRMINCATLLVLCSLQGDPRNRAILGLETSLDTKVAVLGVPYFSNYVV